MKTKRVLVIDNNPAQLELLKKLVMSLGGAPTGICRPDSSSMLPEVSGLLSDQNGPQFDATVLDILFGAETYGGINLWMQLSEGQRGRAGKLLIVTNGGYDRTIDFAARWADGRLCTAACRGHIGAFLDRHIFQES